MSSRALFRHFYCMMQIYEWNRWRFSRKQGRCWTHSIAHPETRHSWKHCYVRTWTLSLHTGVIPHFYDKLKVEFFHKEHVHEILLYIIISYTATEHQYCWGKFSVLPIPAHGGECIQSQRQVTSHSPRGRSYLISTTGMTLCHSTWHLDLYRKKPT